VGVRSCLPLRGSSGFSPDSLLTLQLAREPPCTGSDIKPIELRHSLQMKRGQKKKKGCRSSPGSLGIFKGARLSDFDPHAAAGALHLFDSGINGEAVQVRHLDFCDLLHLLLSNLPDLVLIRLG